MKSRFQFRFHLWLKTIFPWHCFDLCLFNFDSINMHAQIQLRYNRYIWNKNKLETHEIAEKQFIRNYVVGADFYSNKKTMIISYFEAMDSFFKIYFKMFWICFHPSLKNITSKKFQFTLTSEYVFFSARFIQYQCNWISTNNSNSEQN